MQYILFKSFLEIQSVGVSIVMNRFITKIETKQNKSKNHKGHSFLEN